MTQQQIVIGALPNDGTGDPLRLAFEKINNNFSQLFGQGTAAGPDGSIQFKNTNYLHSVVYYGTTYIATGFPYNWFTSPDGSVWTPIATPAAATDTINSLKATPGNIIGVGTGGLVIRSTDGLTWTAATSPTTQNLYSVGTNVSQDTHVAVGANGTIIYSTNGGTTWTDVTSYTAITGDLYGVAHNGSTWVAVGANGTISYSPNLTTWTPATVVPPVTRNINSVTWNGSQFIAVGDFGTILQSSNGSNWVPGYSIPALNDFYNINTSIDANLTVTSMIVGSQGTVITTTDGGLNWTVQTSGVQDSLLTSAFGANTYVVAGNNGTILDSTNTIDWNNVTIPGIIEGSANLIFDEYNSNVLVGSNVIPQQDDTYTLGTIDKRWAAGYFGPEAVYIGNVELRSNNGATLNIIDVNAPGIFGNISANIGTFETVNTNVANFEHVNANTFDANSINVLNAVINQLDSNDIFTVNLTASDTVISNVVEANLVNATDATISNNLSVGNAIAAHEITAHTAHIDDATISNLVIIDSFFFPEGNIEANNIIGNHLFGKLVDGDQPNIYRVGTLLDLTVANTIVGNITGRANIANFTYYTQEANVANTVQENAQPNITSVGTLTGLSVQGNTSLRLGTTLIENLELVSGNITGTLSGIFVGNLIGNASNSFQAQQSFVANVVSNSAQPNITSVGTLSNLSIAGNLSVAGQTTLANANIGNVTTNFVNADTVFTDIVRSNAYFGNVVVDAAPTAVMFGEFYSNASSSQITGNASQLSWNGNILNVNGNVTSHYMSGVITTASQLQPNITQVGNLRGLQIGSPGDSLGAGAYDGFLRVYGVADDTVSAIFTGGEVRAEEGLFVGGDTEVFGGNTTFSGPVRFSVNMPNANSITSFGCQTANSNSLMYGVGGIIDLGTGPNGAPLQANVVSDRGLTYHYYNTTSNADNMAAFVWKSQNSDYPNPGGYPAGEFQVYRMSERLVDGRISNTISTLANGEYNSGFGNIRADWFFGNVGGEGSIGTFDTVNTGNINVQYEANFLGNTNISNVSNLHIPGGLPGWVLTTDGSGNLYWMPQTGGGNGLTLVSANWGVGSGGTNNHAYWWDGNSSEINYKPVTIEISIPDGEVPATVSTLTLNSIPVTGTLVGNTVSILSGSIPDSIQTSSGIVVVEMIVTAASGNVFGPQASVLAPMQIQPSPFVISGTLHAAPTNPAAIPFWEPTLAGSITASGLSLTSGGLTDITYTLTQGNAVIATSGALTNMNNYTFANVAVGNGYAITANANGTGSNGAQPIGSFTATSASANVTEQKYYPLMTYFTTPTDVMPTFDLLDSNVAYQTFQFVNGGQVTLPETLPNETKYAWVATPTTTAHVFSFESVFGAVYVTPDVQGSQYIEGTLYNVYGFTNSLANTVLTIS